MVKGKRISLNSYQDYLLLLVKCRSLIDHLLSEWVMNFIVPVTCFAVAIKLQSCKHLALFNHHLSVLFPHSCGIRTVTYIFLTYPLSVVISALTPFLPMSSFHKVIREI